MTLHQSKKIARDYVDNGFNSIQFDIDKLLDWAENNKIEFSESKTEYKIVSDSHPNNYPNLHTKEKRKK